MTDTKVTQDGRVVETRASRTPAWLIGILFIVLIVVAAFAFGLIDIDQTRQAVAPTVTLESSGGQTPAFDVDTAKVDVGTKTETIQTPTVDVGSKTSTVEVPTVSVEPAGDPNKKN
jgi:hypothetical protein